MGERENPVTGVSLGKGTVHAVLSVSVKTLTFTVSEVEGSEQEGELV